MNRRAMLDARSGAHDTRSIVGSGTFYSTLSRASAAAFGLTTEAPPATFGLRGIRPIRTDGCGKVGSACQARGRPYSTIPLDEADADRKVALTIDPGIAEHAAGYGRE